VTNPPRATAAARTRKKRRWFLRSLGYAGKREDPVQKLTGEPILLIKLLLKLQLLVLLLLHFLQFL